MSITRLRPAGDRAQSCSRLDALVRLRQSTYHNREGELIAAVLGRTTQ